MSVTLAESFYLILTNESNEICDIIPGVNLMKIGSGFNVRLNDVSFFVSPNPAGYVVSFDKNQIMQFESSSDLKEVCNKVIEIHSTAS